MSKRQGKAEVKSRYGTTVHDLFYDSPNKMWYVGCIGVNKGNQFSKGWKEVGGSTPVTCKRCIGVGAG